MTHSPLTTAKPVAAMIASLLAAKGITAIFASPGSRNAPLLVALSRTQGIDLQIVVDERSAAFMALGYASTAGRPAALVCTSGTALLNYLPAVAEAWYRHVPLVVISADRPEAWIDQDDSQTLHQPRALTPYVKARCDLPDPASPSPTDIWWFDREINNALLACTLPMPGPVHINVRLEAPLDAFAPAAAIPTTRDIQALAPPPALTTGEARRLARDIASPVKVLMAIGFMPPDSRVTRALRRLAQLPNVTILAENIANTHLPDYDGGIDGALAAIANLPPQERSRYLPDVVITAGGALVSRSLKAFLRSHKPGAHWHIGLTDNTIDPLQTLTLRVLSPATVFLPQLASALQPHRSDSPYAADWRTLRERCAARARTLVEEAPWCALRAFSIITPAIPRGWNVQASNGTSIRYLQLNDCSALHRTDCNRGVSGIDGATSTAVGAQIAARHAPTLLITGDMSLQYDLTALGTAQVTHRLKVVVMVNGGGGIFRFISSTRSLPELEQCFVAQRPFPVEALADAWGWRTISASTEAELRDGLRTLIAEHQRPAMLVVRTDGATDARLLRHFFANL